jgi:hypothetical protein
MSDLLPSLRAFCKSNSIVVVHNSGLVGDTSSSVPGTKHWRDEIPESIVVKDDYAINLEQNENASSTTGIVKWLSI